MRSHLTHGNRDAVVCVSHTTNTVQNPDIAPSPILCRACIHHSDLNSSTFDTVLASLEDVCFGPGPICRGVVVSHKMLL